MVSNKGLIIDKHVTIYDGFEPQTFPPPPPTPDIFFKAYKTLYWNMLITAP